MILVSARAILSTSPINRALVLDNMVSLLVPCYLRMTEGYGVYVDIHRYLE